MLSNSRYSVWWFAISFNCRWVYLCIAWAGTYRQLCQRRRTEVAMVCSWGWAGRRRRASPARRTAASVTQPVTRTVGNPVSPLHPWWWTTNTTTLLHTAVAVHTLAVSVRDAVSRRPPRVCCRAATRIETVTGRVSLVRARNVPPHRSRARPFSTRSSLTNAFGT